MEYYDGDKTFLRHHCHLHTIPGDVYTFKVGMFLSSSYPSPNVSQYICGKPISRQFPSAQSSLMSLYCLSKRSARIFFFFPYGTSRFSVRGIQHGSQKEETNHTDVSTYKWTSILTRISIASFWWTYSVS